MNRTIGTGGIAMLLLLSLAAIGVGIALWSKVLTIEGIVRTGSVNAEYVRVFTDDDDFVDDPAFDEQDTGDCAISVGPDDSPFGPDNDKDEPDGITSCDPARTGIDPKPHYDKDVARCDAIKRDTDPDQEGDQGVVVAITNGYPSYHCTAWLFIINNGSIPVLLHHALIQNAAAAPCQLGATPYDLDGDGAPDVEICVSGLQCQTGPDGNIECLEPQIDPGDVFPLDIDIHVMQSAPQDAVLTFNGEVCLHQWNEETGFCPQPSCALGNAVDICVDGDGIATVGPGSFSIAAGDAILPASAGGNPAGLDLIERVGAPDGLYSPGDDLMVEDPIGTPICPTALRDAVYNNDAANQDCIVLDPDGSLADGDIVTCDTGAGCGLWFKDDNGNGRYDVGEDLVVDVNGNGIFD